MSGARFSPPVQVAIGVLLGVVVGKLTATWWYAAYGALMVIAAVYVTYYISPDVPERKPEVDRS